MRKTFSCLFYGLLALCLALSAQANPAEFLPGDFIFIPLRGRAGGVIRGTTESAVSHCGVVNRLPDGTLTVIHSLGRVKEETLEKFLKWGQGKYAINRFKTLNQRGRELVVEGAKKFLGWPYDKQYLVTNRSIYCSELLYRALSDGPGIQPVPLAPMDFTVAGDEGWEFWEKFFQGEVPQGEPGIAPSDYLESDLFELIFSNLDQEPDRSTEDEEDPLLQEMHTERSSLN